MRLRHILSGIILFSLMACGEDDGIQGDNILHYDGENVASPTLPPGIYEASARFTSVLMRNVEGRSIEAVSIYMYDIPSAVILTISPDETSTVPALPVYTQEITGQLQSNSWNTVNLNIPYAIDGSALWLGVELNLLAPIQSIGCDAGPADPNGDWLYDGADQEWIKFRDRVGDSINWNIRMILSP